MRRFPLHNNKLHYSCQPTRLFPAFSSSANRSSRKAASFHSTTVRLLSFQLGDSSLQSNVILSPLERISDVGFRRLCHQNGAALTWTEMVYCSELLQQTSSSAAAPAEQQPGGGRNIRRDRGAFLLDTVDPETPTGIQLLVDRTTKRDGWGTTQLQRALERIETGASSSSGESRWRNIVAVDLNFGCPAPAVSRRGAGPAQLRRRSKMRALFEVLKQWKDNINTTLPNLGAVGVKIRLGNTEREQHFKVYLPVAEAAAEVGLDYLTVHARNGEQRSRDPPTWDAIREVKDVCRAISGDNTKIIGNGDVRTHADVEKIMQTTGCDGVMVGRAAMRNPWVFSSLITGQEEKWPTLQQVEAALQENESWSNPQPAAARYERFRKENFERLRHQALRNGTDNNCGRTGRDWYLEWSQASSRRRHLDRMVDEEFSGGGASSSEGTPKEVSPRHGSRRRTSNARQWKKDRKIKQ